MFQEKLVNVLKSKYFPFLILGIGILLVHLLVPIPIGDDIYFSSAPKNIFDFQFLRDRYLFWSSRLIIDFLVVMFLDLPTIVWRLLNSLVIVFLGISLSKIFDKNNEHSLNWFIVLILFTFPFREVSSAGWVTVSINYIWPITFGIYLLAIIKKVLNSEKLNRIEYFSSILVLLIALNHEIMSLILFSIFLIANIYLFKTKKRHWLLLFFLILSVFSLIFIFTTPGNMLRRRSELKWFLDFDSISLVDKLEIGISSTLDKIVYKFNFIYFIFSILLIAAINQKYDDVFYRFISLVPLVVTISLSNGFGFLFDRFFPYLSNFSFSISKYGFITLQNFLSVYSYLPYLILYTTWFIVVISLYLIFKNTWRSVFALAALGLGLSSRIMLALSPTIWVSGERTYSFLLISIIICSLMIIENLLKATKSRRAINNLLIFVGFLGGLSLLDLIMGTV